MHKNYISAFILVFYASMAMADEVDVSHQADACNAFVRGGEYGKGMEAANVVLKANSKHFTTILCKARAQSGLSQYTEALNTLKVAEPLASNGFDRMTVLSMKGNVLKNSDQYAAAMETYQQSLSLARTEKNKRFERINLNQIGDLHMLSKSFQPALESYLAGGKLAANDNERADNYEKTAAAYSKLNQHDSAIEYQVKAIVMEERSGDLDHYANAELELGKIYTLASQYDKAEKSIAKIIKLSKEQGGAYWEAKSYFYLAQAKLANHQAAAAKSLLNDASQICSSIGEDSLNSEITKLLGSIQ